jgi:hypothetical protein
MGIERTWETLAAATAAAVLAGAAPAQDWRTLAACAAAYRVNAKVSAPDRPVSMTGQVSEVAEDYEKAAAAAYRQATQVREATARGAVAAYAAKRGTAFGKQPRRTVERFIDACPQLETP